MDPMGYATFTTHLTNETWHVAMPMLCQRPEGVSEILGEVGETDSGATWQTETRHQVGPKTRANPQVGVEIYPFDRDFRELNRHFSRWIDR